MLELSIIHRSAVTTFSVCVLFSLAIGCSGRAHLASVPNYESMADAAESLDLDETGADVAVAAPIASSAGNVVPTTSTGSSSTWIYGLAGVLAIAAAATVTVKLRAKDSNETPTKEQAERNESDESAQASEDPKEDQTGQNRPPSSKEHEVAMDSQDFELDENDADWSDSEIELDSVVLLREEDAPPVRPAIKTLETGEKDESASAMAGKLNQLRLANQAATENLEKALAKIGKLKSKLREKIGLIDRLQSSSAEFDESKLADMGEDALKERLRAIAVDQKIDRERIDYLTDRNSKLKAKLWEKVELIETLRAAEPPSSAEELQALDAAELTEKLVAMQNERGKLKAELAHATEWNEKLKSKLREKVQIIEDFQGQREASTDVEP